jgi:hypothetical protein
VFFLKRNRTGASCSKVRAVLLILAPTFLHAEENLPAPGAWDGVTQKAKLDRPYEDSRQALIPFGINSYFSHPWRSYMDTHPASQFLGSMAFCYNSDRKYLESILQFMSEAGIRKVRTEMGWGNLDWDDRMTGENRTKALEFLRLAKKYQIRPLLLLNAHHSAPGPVREVSVTLVADAKKGERSFKVRPDDVSKIRLGYTGPMNPEEYCAAKPLITEVKPDGTCLLSGPLGGDLKAGTLQLKELKYQPLHGVKLKSGDQQANAEAAASAAETQEGWKKYVAEICNLGLEGVGGAEFDLEVWNEQTFGSNFLDINNYYDPDREYNSPVQYTRSRPQEAGIRPDAPKKLKLEGPMVLVGWTVDYVRSRPELAAVKVDNGIGNQWPWNGGGDAWFGQDAYSRHYYHGGWTDVSPQTVPRPDLATMNALGEIDGQRPEKARERFDIIPGSNFIPTTRIGHPEAHHCGWKTESLVRDVLPDSRLGGEPLRHGRFTHNGDYKTPELWQTEVNFARDKFFNELFDKTEVKREDPRANVLDDYMTSKMLLRQYVFHNHKGLRNLYMFGSGEHPFAINMVGRAFYQALDLDGLQLTDEVRQAAPSVYRGLGWLTREMEASDPIVAPRRLSVEELWEYKPRLIFAGDGSAERPHQWNRDWFAFLPYQLTASKFLVPYYVMTVDAYFSWNPDKDAFDPARYAMPEQELEVTIGNCAGAGAKVSVYDPLTNESVPVELVKEKCSTNQLTVKLKTVDYPRFLLVEEAEPGILIQDPKVTSDNDGTLSISWHTNIPAESARITFGKDWPNRAANEQVLSGGKEDYHVKIPTGTKGILAARIFVEANGLTCVWPRWDEDPQGQTVVPGSASADVTRLRFEGPASASGKASEEASALEAKPSVVLPVKREDLTYRYTISLPDGVAFTGPSEDQEASLGQGKDRVRLRARYISGGNRNPVEGALPFLAVGDEIRKTKVRLPAGIVATQVELNLAPELHPGLSGLRRRYLFIPMGREKTDLLVLAADGSPLAMTNQDDVIQAIFASYRETGE